MLLNIFSVALSDVINRGFFLLFSIVVARLISPAEFGFYSLSISLGFWLWSVIDVGLTAHGTRLLAQSGEVQEVIGRVIGSRLANLFVLGTLYYSILFLFPIPSGERVVYMLALLYVVGMCLFPAWVARSQHDNFAYAVYYVIVVSVGAFFLAGLAVGLLPNSDIGAIISRNAAWIIGSMIAFFVLIKRLKIIPNFSIDIQMLRESVPLGGAAALYTLIPLVPFLALRLLGWQDSLGLYGALWQLQLVLIAGATVMSIVFLPTYAKALVSGGNINRKRLVQRHFILVTCVAVLVCVAFWQTGAAVLGILFGDAYNDLGVFILPFSIALFFVYHRVSVDAILIAQGNYALMLISGIIALVISIIASVMADSPVYLAWVYMTVELLLFMVNSSITIAGFDRAV